MRPHFCHVKDVPPVRLRLLGIHDLHEDVPLGEVALLNGLEEVLRQIIRVLAGRLGGDVGGEVLDAGLGLDVELDVLECAVLYISYCQLLCLCVSRRLFGREGFVYLFGKLVCVAAVGVDVAERGGRSAVVEEVHEGVDAFRVA